MTIFFFLFSPHRFANKQNIIKVFPHQFFALEARATWADQKLIFFFPFSHFQQFGVNGFEAKNRQVEE